jgi:hypothetical protein
VLLFALQRRFWKMNKYSEDDWLDEARVSIYEETKDMTRKERVAYMKEQAAPVYEQYNIRRAPALSVQKGP